MGPSNEKRGMMNKSTHDPPLSDTGRLFSTGNVLFLSPSMWLKWLTEVSVWSANIYMLLENSIQIENLPCKDYFHKHNTFHSCLHSNSCQWFFLPNGFFVRLWRSFKEQFVLKYRHCKLVSSDSRPSRLQLLRLKTSFHVAHLAFPLYSKSEYDLNVHQQSGSRCFQGPSSQQQVSHEDTKEIKKEE